VLGTRKRRRFTLTGEKRPRTQPKRPGGGGKDIEDVSSPGCERRKRDTGGKEFREGLFHEAQTKKKNKKKKKKKNPRETSNNQDQTPPTKETSPFFEQEERG